MPGVPRASSGVAYRGNRGLGKGAEPLPGVVLHLTLRSGNMGISGREKWALRALAKPGKAPGGC